MRTASLAHGIPLTAAETDELDRLRRLGLEAV